MNFMITVATFYKFQNLTNLTLIQTQLKAKMQELQIKGTILIGEEGINSTIAGSDQNIKEFYNFITVFLNSEDINWKLSYTEIEPFEKIKVRIKKEIVSMKKEIKNTPGQYIEPEEWDDFISQDDVILIETRNDYEYNIGCFKDSVLPPIEYFREFPKWIDEYLRNIPKDNKFAMFCTGGIRCEKTTAYLKDKGYNNVYHLKGGILNYFEKTKNKNKKWDGLCFVFDDRIAVDDKLKAHPEIQVKTMNYTKKTFEYSNLIKNTTPYPFAEIDKKVQEMKNKGINVIDFGVGDPTSPTPDFIIEELYKAAKKHKNTGYPSYIGLKNFRDAFSEYFYKNFNVKLNPETEITSNIGSKEAVFNFPLAFINPGDYVICPTPGYPPYASGTKFAGGIPYFVPLLEKNNFLIDLDLIPEEICKKAKIIWINYPNSPTGALATDEWYLKLISWARKYNIIIAADEGCYIDIYFDKKPKSILEFSKEGIVVFYSLSKRNNMTGYRVGCVAGDEFLINGFKKIKTNIDSGTPSFIQEAAIAALKDEKHIEEMRKEYNEKREKMIEVFEKIGLEKTKSEATFYIWQKVPKNMSDVEFAEKLIEIGIVVVPGSFISNKTTENLNAGEGYIRLAMMPTLQEVEEACIRILKLKF